MQSMFEIVYDIVFDPYRAMKEHTKKQHIGLALMIVLLSIIIPIVAYSFSVEPNAMLPMIIVFQVVVSIVIWLIKSAMWQLFAEFIDGKGTAVGLFTALGFAHLVWIFIIPLWMLVSFMSPDIQAFLVALIILFILCWFVYLEIVALKSVHQLSMAKAILVVVMPVLFSVLLWIISVVFMLSIMMMNKLI